MNDTIDDRTASYIFETRRPFEDLRQVASQLAGLLVLAASGARSAVPDHPMLVAAGEMFAQAAEQIRVARPSARALAHHQSLLCAVAAIEQSLRVASTDLRSDRPAGVDAVLAPLKIGYEQLQRAADQLPGFELIAFNQGCCVGGQVERAGPLDQVRRTD